MKCGTSTLHDQLAAQPGIFMTTPKEPNYFSDDRVFGRGWTWYESQFRRGVGAQLCGESSTHYTKLPTYPYACARMKEALPDLKLLYMMRHPIDRLVSHYVHEWSQRVVHGTIEQALETNPELIEYGRYAMQLEPYVDAFGKHAILPIFLERFQRTPQQELSRICTFLGYDGEATFNKELTTQNVSSERMRLGAVERIFVTNRWLTIARRRLVPARVRTALKRRVQMRERPEFSPETKRHLESIFDRDLERIGSWLGTKLDCQSFTETVSERPFALV